MASDLSAGLVTKPSAAPPISTGLVPKPNYSMDAVPQFLKDNLDMGKVNVSPIDPAVSGVKADSQGYEDGANPYNLHVAPSVGQPVFNHELTHTFQDVSGAKFAPINEKDPYNYGGTAGLLQAQTQGKKITDFSPEQVSRMVEDHTAKTSNLAQWVKLGVAKPEDIADYKQWKSAVGPYVSQLAALGGKKTYAAPADTSDTLNDLPEMSNTQIQLAPAKPLF